MPRVRPSTVGTVSEQVAQAPDREATAAYVAAITQELSALVRRQKLDTLGYLLDMVRLEAEGVVQRAGSGGA